MVPINTPTDNQRWAQRTCVREVSLKSNFVACAESVASIFETLRTASSPAISMHMAPAILQHVISEGDID
jgi:hypothetical protein